MSRRSHPLSLAAFGAAAALVLAGCSADPLNVVILNARAPGDKCDFADSTLYVEGGSVDFSPWTDANGNSGQTAFYGQVFSWSNQMLPAPISVNGQVVDPGGGNDFIADSVVYNYQYSDPNVVLSPETENVRAVIQAAGTAEKNSVGAQLIQPQAAAAINTALNANGSPQTLLVTFQMFGKTGAGVGKNTNKVSFPVTVYKATPAGVSCPLGFVLFGGPCNEPGRDSPVHCIKSG